MRKLARITFVLLLVGLVVASGLIASTAFAGNAKRGDNEGNQGNPRVLPPGSMPYGKSYGDWGAAWWTWAFTFTAADIPFNQPGGPTDCSLHQSGDVWFLAGSNVGPVTRTCTVPVGKALFFPLANLVDDWPCPDPNFKPAEGQTLEEFLTNDAANYIPWMTGLFATFDGVDLLNMTAYRGTSHLFMFTADLSLSAGDPCITGTPQYGVADGYWLFLPPLPVGQHTVHFGSTGWGQDVTYILTVGGEPSASVGGGVTSEASVPGGVPSTWGHVKATYR